jgi:Ras-related protein Rab-2A
MDELTADFAFKFVLVGDSSVGKTSILARFRDDSFPAHHHVTVGVTFSTHRLHMGSTALQCQIWDTAGQEIYRSITRTYYRDTDCAIVVCDLGNRATFESISDWVGIIRNVAPPRCKIVIVGNKADLDREVSREDFQSFAQSVDLPCFETSALKGDNILRLFEECAMLVYTANMINNSTNATVEELNSRMKDGKTKEKCCS